MLTEVAEEKKAWKKKRRHLWTFQWMKIWLKVLWVCYGACCIMEILKGIWEISNPLCSFIRHHWREAYGSFTQPDKADKKYNNLLLSCCTPKNGLNKPLRIIRPQLNWNPGALQSLSLQIDQSLKKEERKWWIYLTVFWGPLQSMDWLTFPQQK